MKKKRYVLMSAVVVSALLIGCSSDNMQKDEQEAAQNMQVQIEKQVNVNVNNLIDKFLAGEMNADGNGLYVEESFNISDLQMDEEEWDSYSVGDRIDLDNDGEDELILNGPYGGMYLDSSSGKVKVFASGDGTASNLSYTNCDDEIWIVHSDTMHSGREYYRLEKYSGADNVTASITLEIYEQDENGSKKYYLNGNEVSQSEYDELYQKFFGGR